MEHEVVVFDDGSGPKMWTIAGRYSTSVTAGLDDVWSSTDGITWTQTTPWLYSPREGHLSLVFDNGTGEKMWIIAGMDLTWNPPTADNYIWHSSDGISWTQVSATIPFLNRAFHAGAVFDNGTGAKMWVLGGKTYGGTGFPYSDVWSSSDGSTWTQVTSAAAWPGRREHEAVVFNNKLWVLGGIGASNVKYNDVWSTTDGGTWTQSVPSGPIWSARSGHSVAVYNNKMWVIGGVNASNVRLNDVWSTTDGVNWTEETSAAPWTARYGADTVVYNGKLWLSGGRDPAYKRDVWSFTDATPSAPSINTTPVTTALVGTPYSYQVSASGNPAPVLTLNSSATGFPSWLSVSGDTLTGTPQPGDEGVTINIEVTATNSQGSDVQSFSITVNRAPGFTSTAPTTAVATQQYTYTPAVVGYPAPVLSLGATVPSWLSLNAAGDTVQGAPAVGDIGGPYNFTITATNSFGTPHVENVSLTVTGIAPSFISTPITTGTAGAAYTYTVQAAGVPTSVLSATTLPAWLSFDPGTGILTGTPSAGDIGTAGNDVVIQAVNSQGSVSQTFTIGVSGVAPSFSGAGPATTATTGLAYTTTISATGIPAPTLSGVSIPAWLNFDPGTGVLSGTPSTGDIGANAVEIDADNAWGSDTLSFAIQVNGVAPIVTSTPPATAVAGQLYTYTIQGTGNPPPSFAVSGVPAWLNFDSVNTISGVPLEANVGLSATITVTASNGQSPNGTQAFQIDVQGVAPVITSTPVTGATGTLPYSYTVTATGIPAPTFSASGLPSWLTFNPATGVLSGTPNNNDEGINGPVTITASNGWGIDATQVFTIDVDKAVSGGGNDGDGGCSTSSAEIGALEFTAGGFLLLLSLTFRRNRRRSQP